MSELCTRSQLIHQVKPMVSGHVTAIGRKRKSQSFSAPMSIPRASTVKSLCNKFQVIWLLILYDFRISGYSFQWSNCLAHLNSACSHEILIVMNLNVLGDVGFRRRTTHNYLCSFVIIWCIFPWMYSLMCSKTSCINLVYLIYWHLYSTVSHL